MHGEAARYDREIISESSSIYTFVYVFSSRCKMTFSVKAKAKAPVENGIGAGRVLLIMTGAIAAVAGMAALVWFSGVDPAGMFVLL